MTLPFRILHTHNEARAGVLSTAHGEIRTPAFMPVGTAGTVKAMTPEAVRATGAEIILANTYHLMLRPGAERIAKLGGLHHFMHWDGPILTDSGGFQVMSLAKLRTMSEEAVTFRSHLDGATYVLTPERAMEIQYLLGADISMVLDECTPYPATEEEAAQSMRLSMRWAKRSKQACMSHPPSIPPACGGDVRGGRGVFGIVQGGVYPALRKESCDALMEIGFDGYAIGGLAVGEGQEVMFATLDVTLPHLPAEAPRYLMGVGKPDDIVGAVARGVDMFDCVIPTRSGRFARAYTHSGEVNLRNACHADDAAPLEAGCPCAACMHYSRAYLHHLFKADEMLGPMLLTAHNLTFYQRLMRQLREAIAAGKLDAFVAGFLQEYRRHCEEC